MARNTLIEIDVNQVVGLADRVGALDAEAFADSAVKALNTTIDSAYELSRNRITAGINISDDYLRRRMEVGHASRSKLEASITATGDSRRMTRLVHYSAQMIIAPRKSKQSRSTGALKLPSGGKQAGVRVNVKTPKVMDSAFMLPLKQGSTQGEKLGVFVRDGNRLKHLYGPSVYQLFRYQAAQINDEVADELQENLLSEVDVQIREVFG